MKVAIIGAGALGTLVGGLLIKSGEEVWLYNPSFREHTEFMRNHGLTIEKGKEKYRLKVRATWDIQEVRRADLVGIFVKAYDTHKAIKEALPLISPETLVMSLQNGLGNIDEIAKYIPKSQIVRGITSLGATLVGPGHVRWAGWGDTLVGQISNQKDEKLDKVINIFNRAGMKTHPMEEVEEYVWKKLLINAGINPLTALFDIKNGKLLDLQNLMEIMHSTVREGVKVANRLGISIDSDEMIKEMEKVCRLTSENISSMLQDVRKGKRTEIDYINGAIVREGKKKGVSTPVNLILTLLVKDKVCATANGGNWHENRDSTKR